MNLIEYLLPQIKHSNILQNVGMLIIRFFEKFFIWRFEKFIFLKILKRR